MPKKGKGESDKGFTYSGSGTNNKGNHYCSRDYGNGSNAYHYSNKDGSYYYANPDGSKYYNSGDGYSMYTPPPSGDSSTDTGKPARD